MFVLSDGMLQQIFSSSRQAPVSQPFHLQSEAQKEMLYEKIAEQLAAIADYYNVQLEDLTPKLQHKAGGETKEVHSAPTSPLASGPAAAAAAAADSSNSDGGGRTTRKTSMKAQQQRLMQKKKRRWRKELALQQQIAAAHANTAGQGTYACILCAIEPH